MLDISKISFIYRGTDYGYDGHSNCSEYGCRDEGICRCYRIDDAWVKSVDLMEVTNHIYDKIYGGNSQGAIRNRKIQSVIGDEAIDKYFINRLLTIHKLYDPENWTVNYGPDYYGDEVHDVNILNCAPEFNQDMTYMNNEFWAKVEYLLFKEYGYLNPKLSDKSWKLDIIEKDDIVFPQRNHYDEVSTGLEYYDDSVYNLPKGIVMEINGKYQVIDGYHRLKNSNTDIVEVIVAYDGE